MRGEELRKASELSAPQGDEKQNSNNSLAEEAEAAHLDSGAVDAVELDKGYFDHDTDNEEDDGGDEEDSSTLSSILSQISQDSSKTGRAMAFTHEPAEC